jgi:hypothetical protein
MVLMREAGQSIHLSMDCPEQCRGPMSRSCGQQCIVSLNEALFEAKIPDAASLGKTSLTSALLGGV